MSLGSRVGDRDRVGLRKTERGTLGLRNTKTMNHQDRPEEVQGENPEIILTESTIRIGGLISLT